MSITVEGSSVFVVNEKSGSSCSVCLDQGATITSWKSGELENLFLSKKAQLNQPGKAVRGGIPICFPKFGPWDACPSTGLERPKHGFARNATTWKVDSFHVDSNSGDVTLKLVLTDSECKAWTHSFKFMYTIILAKLSLTLNCVISNTATDVSNSWDFTLALHPYFNVKSGPTCSVIGLKGVEYLDKNDEGKLKMETDEKLTVGGSVDRVYLRSPDECTLIGLCGGSKGDERTVKLFKKNMADTVVWNPWVDGAKSMSDFGDEEYRDMICVEGAQVSTPIKLAPQESWECSFQMTVSE